MRKNNAIGLVEPYIAEVKIDVRFQGSRKVEHLVYDDIDKFNLEWVSIKTYWEDAPDEKNVLLRRERVKKMIERLDSDEL